MGPSGVGKSTLLHVLAGVLTPTSGSVQMSRAASCVSVFQTPFGAPQLSVREHVTLPLLRRGLRESEARGRVDSCLTALGLGAIRERRLAELSGGQAQRLMLARALACQPDVLLVDEPTAQLDRTSAAEVIEALSQLRGYGVITVIATHDFDVAAAADRVVDLSR